MSMDDLCGQQIKRLAEALYAVSPDVQRKLVEDTAEYTAIREQIYQLSLALAGENQGGITATPVQQTAQPVVRSGNRRGHKIVFGWYGDFSLDDTTPIQRTRVGLGGGLT